MKHEDIDLTDIAEMINTNRDYLRKRLDLVDYLKKLQRGSATLFSEYRRPTCNHFPHVLNNDQIKRLFIFLCNSKYISHDTDLQAFTWHLGGLDNAEYFSDNNEIVPTNKYIVWQSTKQILREMLTKIYYPKISKKEIVSLTPFCFGYRNKQSGEISSFSLAKPKAIPSTESDKLKSFLATL